MRRRTFLAHAASAHITAALAAPFALAAEQPLPMGLNTYCLRALKWHDRQLLEYCAARKLDAVFLQDSLDPQAQEPAHWKEVRALAQQLGLHLETGGGAILPKSPEAFEATVAMVRQQLTRAAAMGSPFCRGLLAADREHLPPGPVTQHMEMAVKLLRAIRSQAVDLGVKIALENHKDLQAWETRQVIDAAGTDVVGSYLDTGNPVFVLENPLTTVETLGPVALTFHLRDSVVYEAPRGVAVQWVPLGEGTVDFPALVKRFREVATRPVHVYIKPITGRPPQILPYLEPSFWERYPAARARDLSSFLALAKGGRPYEKHMVIEDLPGRPVPEAFTGAIQYQQREHMERSIAYAVEHLNLGVRARRT